MAAWAFQRYCRWHPSFSSAMFTAVCLLLVCAFMWTHSSQQVGEISKLPGNEKWSVSGITIAMLPSPGAELDSHLTEKSRAECVCVCVCVLVSQLVPAPVCVPHWSVHVWDVVVFRGAEGKVAVVFKAQHWQDECVRVILQIHCGAQCSLHRAVDIGLYKCKRDFL